MSLKVYFLDDEKDLGQMFKDNFETPEIAITVFSDPYIATQTALQSPPDIMFVDYQMPGMTGDDVVNTIGSRFPIILLTGNLTVDAKANFSKRFCKQPFPWKEIEEIFREFQKGKFGS